MGGSHEQSATVGRAGQPDRPFPEATGGTMQPLGQLAACAESGDSTRPLGSLFTVFSAPDALFVILLLCRRTTFPTSDFPLSLFLLRSISLLLLGDIPHFK